MPDRGCSSITRSWRFDTSWTGCSTVASIALHRESARCAGQVVDRVNPIPRGRTIRIKNRWAGRQHSQYLWDIANPEHVQQGERVRLHVLLRRVSHDRASNLRFPQRGRAMATAPGDGDPLGIDVWAAHKVVYAADPVPTFHACRRITSRMPPPATFAIGAMMKPNCSVSTVRQT